MSRLIDANYVIREIVKERDKIPLTVPGASYELGFMRDGLLMNGEQTPGAVTVNTDFLGYTTWTILTTIADTAVQSWTWRCAWRSKMPFICEKNHSCCNYQYYDSALDIEEPCDHLIEVDYVVHAEWIEVETYNTIYLIKKNGQVIDKRRHLMVEAMCSNCKMRSDHDAVRFEEFVKRCPICGAIMDKEV